MRKTHVIDATLGQAMGRAEEFTAPSHWPVRANWSGSELVLLVEPDDGRRDQLRDAVRAVANIHGEADFLTARMHLISKPYDWLFTNIRLGAYNGLHLVQMAAASQPHIRTLVYEDHRDLWLAREAQRAGAFYEFGNRVDRALPAYLRGMLPAQDRRNPAEPDRRVPSRGGRRCTDAPLAQAFA